MINLLLVRSLILAYQRLVLKKEKVKILTIKTQFTTNFQKSTEIQQKGFTM